MLLFQLHTMQNDLDEMNGKPVKPQIIKLTIGSAGTDVKKQIEAPQGPEVDRQTKATGFKMALVVLVVGVAGVAGFLVWQYFFAIPSGTETSTNITIPFFNEVKPPTNAVDGGGGTGKNGGDDDDEKPPEPVIFQPRSPLIPVKAGVLAVKVEELTDFEGALERLSAQLKPEEGLRPVAAVIQDQTGEREFERDDLLNSLNIVLPTSLSSSLSEGYTLYLKNINNGTRAALIFKLRSLEEAKSAMNKWEPTLTESVYPWLFFGEEALSLSSPNFLDGVYQNIFYRARWLSDANLGIFYAFLEQENMLVITTAQDLLRDVINQTWKEARKTPLPQQLDQRVPSNFVVFARFAQISREAILGSFAGLQQLDYPSPATILVLPVLESTEEKRSLDVEEVLTALQIQPPGDLVSLLGKEKAFYLSSYNDENRFVLITETAQAPSLRELLRGWEPRLTADLAVFLLADEARPNTEFTTFKEGSYNGTVFRYIQYPDADLGLAYATINDKFFIIASSKDSYRFFADRLR